MSAEGGGGHVAPPSKLQQGSGVQSEGKVGVQEILRFLVSFVSKSFTILSFESNEHLNF